MSYVIQIYLKLHIMLAVSINCAPPVVATVGAKSVREF